MAWFVMLFGVCSSNLETLNDEFHQIKCDTHVHPPVENHIFSFIIHDISTSPLFNHYCSFVILVLWRVTGLDIIAITTDSVSHNGKFFRMLGAPKNGPVYKTGNVYVSGMCTLFLIHLM